MNKLTTLLAASLLAACASTVTPPAAPDLAGTWAFDLEASAPAKAMQAECAGDAACWTNAKREASHEKIRFASDGTWTSFSADGAKENVFRQAKLELIDDGPSRVLAKAGPKTMHIEFVDAHTIALDDESKGRLVFVKE